MIEMTKFPLSGVSKTWDTLDNMTPLRDVSMSVHMRGIAPSKRSTNWDSFVSQIGGSAMAGKREKPEEIVSTLRQVEFCKGKV